MALEKQKYSQESIHTLLEGLRESVSVDSLNQGNIKETLDSAIKLLEQDKNLELDNEIWKDLSKLQELEKSGRTNSDVVDVKEFYSLIDEIERKSGILDKGEILTEDLSSLSKYGKHKDKSESDIKKITSKNKLIDEVKVINNIVNSVESMLSSQSVIRRFVGNILKIIGERAGIKFTI